MTAIERNGEYFDFDESLILSKEVKALNAITSTSTFSYESEMPDTAKNRRILGIETLNSVKSIYQAVDVTLHLSQLQIQCSLRVEGIQGNIQFSVFSDSFDFLNLITGTLKDVPYYNYPFGTLADRRVNETGYIDILINNGNNKFALNSSFSLNLVTCLYVKDVIKDIFNQYGFSLQGDILKDWRYNHLLVSNNSVYVEYDEQYIDEHTVYVGKQANQSVTGATAITFPYESGIFYDPQGWWDTTNSRIQVERSRSIGWEINLIFSTLGAHTIEIRDDLGITSLSTTADPTKLGFTWTDASVMLPTRTYRVFVTPASGTINVSSSSTAKFFVLNEGYLSGIKARFSIDEVLPRFIVPDMDAIDFVSQVFGMFNSILDFNPASKVLTVNFFDKIKDRDEEDWSEYVSSYYPRFTDVVDEYGKRSLLLYDGGDDQFIEDYNLRNPVPYGGGQIVVPNDFIQEEAEILTIDFPPTLQEQNDAAQAYLPTMAYFDEDGNEEKFTNRILIGVANVPVSNFSNLTSINSISSMPYGWFAKPNVRKGIDNIVENIAFDNPGLSYAYTGQTLKDNYYSQLERVLNDPVLIVAEMYLPENVFNNFNPSTPKRIKTKDINSQFFVRLIEGWEASHLPCTVELIKLS